MLLLTYSLEPIAYTLGPFSLDKISANMMLSA
jgi:hypothetical protein